MADTTDTKITSSGTTDINKLTTYKSKSNDKNTLSITNYFQLLATQLANQDYTNPMDNSEMMAQMSQMAMVQSLTSMTDTMNELNAFNHQNYSIGLIGKQVEINVPEDVENGTKAVQKTGIVETVSLTGDTPTIKLVGDNTEYSYSNVKTVTTKASSTGTTSSTSTSGTSTSSTTGPGSTSSTSTTSSTDTSSGTTMAETIAAANAAGGPQAVDNEVSAPTGESDSTTVDER
jgi:flagellar basal-body rod modification protein FlgD